MERTVNTNKNNFITKFNTTRVIVYRRRHVQP